MKSALLIFSCLLLACIASAQQYGRFYPREITPSQTPARPAAPEICGNGIDDDGNGLKDGDDFSCYFDSTFGASCLENKVIWGCTGSALYWTNLATNTEHFVGNLTRTLYDISWASNGKLYGLEPFPPGISEVDPYTGTLQLKTALTGYQTPNAMAADGNGNLYVAAYRPSSAAWAIARVTIGSWQITNVALLPVGVASGGDITFFNGSLYLSCNNSQIAKVDAATGSVQMIQVFNAPSPTIMGIVTLGDGHMYLSHNNRIYRLDPSTWTVEQQPVYSFSAGNMVLFGLSNYTETCAAQGCNAKVAITKTTAPPYCSGTGAKLKAISPQTGPAAYVWTKPGGGTHPFDTLTALQTGMYYVSYYSLPDSCPARDSVYIQIQAGSNAVLGGGTVVCPGASTVLSPQGSGILSYLWSDGSTGPSLTVTTPGTYWLEITNTCGTARDTVMVSAAALPQLELGSDTLLCPGGGTVLKNLPPKHPSDKYLWWNGGTADSASVSTGGTFWLQATNGCGSVKDSVTVILRDSCSCTPFYPSVNLGDDHAICPWDSVGLQNLVHQPGYRYRWEDGSTTPTRTVHTPGWYRVEVSTWCETKLDSVLVSLKPSGCEREVFIPNAFTPNGDGKNDVFRPTAIGPLESFELVVYNRWGGIVMHSRHAKGGWDGTLAGALQPSGVYVWSCRYRFTGMEEVQRKGTVVLVR